MENNTQAHEKIQSDLDYINNQMSIIQNRVNNALLHSENKQHTVESSKQGNKIYDSMNKVMDTYYKAHNELLKKIEKESREIQKAGEAFYQTDVAEAQKAKEL